MLARRFTQPARLARALARVSGKPLVVDRPVRRRRKSLAGLAARLQRRNAWGAPAINRGAARRAAGRYAGSIAARIVVLVDSVFAAGSAAEARAKALLRAKAAKVHVATLARVVRSVDVSI